MSSIALEQRRDLMMESSVSARVHRPFPPGVADIVCIEEPDPNVPPRMHERSTIIIVRTPTVVRLESSRALVAHPNCILLIPPHQLYALRSATGLVGGIRRPPVILQVGPSHLSDLALSRRPAVVRDPGSGERLEKLVLQLQRPLRSADCDTEIQAIIDQLGANASAIDVARSGFALETLTAVRSYLDAHMDEQISTATLSRFSGLTESHLIRAFHREFGLPPHAYHMQMRLAQACEALISGLSVSTVAYECGFADQSHLSRKFKDAYRLTPAAWAKAVCGSGQFLKYSWQ